MHEVFKYAEAIMNDPAKEKEFKNITCKALERMKLLCPEEYFCMLYKIHCLVYGPHFDEELAKLAVSRMKNVYGTYGEHWTMEQTSMLAEKHGIKDKCDFYFTIHMMYSDYANVLGGDAELYARMAKAYICDPDATAGKAFELWIATMKK